MSISFDGFINNELRGRLRRWARWRMSTSRAYPNKALTITTIVNAAEGNYHSEPPRGVEMPDDIAETQQALDKMKQRGLGSQVEFIEYFYFTGGENKDKARHLGIHVTTLEQHRRVAESALAGVMCMIWGVKTEE